MEWRRGWDSNPRWGSAHTPLAGERLKPLGHLSVDAQDSNFFYKLPLAFLSS